MPSNTAYAVDQLLIPAAALLFLVWSIIGAAVGAGLIVRSAGMFRMFAVLNRYVSTRHGFKALSTAHDLGAFVRRHRRTVGVVFILCAGYSMFGLTEWRDSAAVVSTLGLRYPSAFVAWIVESAWWYLSLCSVAGIVVGVMLVFFPETLRKLELMTNQWYSVRKATIGVDTMHFSLDKLVEAFPRSAGTVILLAALYVAVNAAFLWLKLK